MRILHCIPSMEGGGAERQLAYLAGQLEQLGCQVHVALTREGAYFPRLRATGATVHQLGPCGTHDPRIFFRLMRTIARVKPDLVQCWLLQMEVLGGLACLATRTPWLFSERSSALAYPPTVKHALRTRMASAADAIVANSRAGSEYWHGRASAAVPRYVVHNGLPLDEIDAAPVADPDPRFEPGLATILFAGRFDAGKNIASLIEAVHRVRTADPPRALLMGDGPLRTDLARLVVARGLAGRVRITGFEPNIWGVMKGATMLVSLSRFEGSPNVVLEAMACGCPVVLSDIEPHRELVDERGALFVNPEDIESVARTIEQVIADPLGARRRAACARARAEEHALPLVAQAYRDVYEDVLTRARARKRTVA